MTLACLLSVPAHAQDNAKPATEKWRPKNAIYVRPGKNFCDVEADVDCNPDPKKRTQKEVLRRRRQVMTIRRGGDNSLFWNLTNNGSLGGARST
jgi:hypothetical protein